MPAHFASPNSHCRTYSATSINRWLYPEQDSRLQPAVRGSQKRSEFVSRKVQLPCFDCRFCLARRTTDFCGFLKSGPKFGSADHFRFRSPPERCRHSLNLGSDVCRSPCLREGFSECRGVCSLQASDNRASAKVINHCLAGSFAIGEMPIRDLTSFPAIVHCG